eukprot:466700_1
MSMTKMGIVGTQRINIRITNSQLPTHIHYASPICTIHKQLPNAGYKTSKYCESLNGDGPDGPMDEDNFQRLIKPTVVESIVCNGTVTRENNYVFEGINYLNDV